MLVKTVALTVCGWGCSTYIKLGQFIASSPTLFPAEYVLEMQQCLDSAPPVPWPVIKCAPQPRASCTLTPLLDCPCGDC